MHRKLPVLAAWLVLIGGAMAFTPPSSDDLVAADRYFGILKSLPSGKASYERVEKLLEKLIELNPRKASTYFGLGMLKLRHADVMSKEGKEMTRELVRAVRRSGLPESLVSLLVRRMNRAYIITCGGGGGNSINDDFSGSPSPTPAP